MPKNVYRSNEVYTSIPNATIAKYPFMSSLSEYSPPPRIKACLTSIFFSVSSSQTKSKSLSWLILSLPNAAYHRCRILNHEELTCDFGFKS